MNEEKDFLKSELCNVGVHIKNDKMVICMVLFHKCLNIANVRIWKEIWSDKVEIGIEVPLIFLI